MHMNMVGADCKIFYNILLIYICLHAQTIYAQIQWYN